MNGELLIATDRGIDRSHGFGVDYSLSIMDRFGMWLSEKQILRYVHGVESKRVADIGCGHYAVFARRILERAAHVTLIDLSIDADVKRHPKVTALEGPLPDVLRGVSDSSFDVIVCNNVLEHLWQPRLALEHIRRAVAPGGVAFVNVPSWLGKFVLESAAFRLNWTSAPEIDDHKCYYARRDLWRLLVESGFKPSQIECRSHKFGLNTFAVCHVPRRGG